MSGAISTAEATGVRLIPENSIHVLSGVRWQDYVRYRDVLANDGVRMYYSDGELLLMTTGQLHERIRALLGQLLYLWAEQQDQAIMCFGQWTLQKKLVEKGLEADNCYYVSHVADVEGKTEIDLEHDPPPDLAIEVDITTHSQHKFDIFSGLGVPEVWVWREDHIAVFRLGEEGAYAEVGHSSELTGFPLGTAADVLLAEYTRNDMAVMKAFREALSAE